MNDTELREELMPKTADATEVDNSKIPCTLDLLLSTNLDNFKRRTKDVEIPSLSCATGTKFIVELRQLAVSQEEEIIKLCTNLSFDSDGETEYDYDSHREKLLILIDAVYFDGKPFFKNKDIMKKFNAKIPTQLVEKLLNRGEISKLYKEYRELTGFNKNSVIDLKNE